MPWRVTSRLSMLLTAPKSTRRASASELMPCASGVEVGHSLMGQRSVAGCAISGGAASSADATSRIVGSAFESRGMAVTVSVR